MRHDPAGLRGACAITLLWFGAAFASAAAGAPADAAAPMLAGLLPCTADVQASWPFSGTWLFPIGDSLEFGHAQGSSPGYKINRGVLTVDDGGAEHDGDDLANGEAGGVVRAAASGIVVTADALPAGGYGCHLVIAHHLDDGALVYTVYAHLLAGSIAVRDGASVSAGQRIARVGQTGRASTPHLHFEVRVPIDSTLRWEKCPVVDPVAFVRMRLPAARPDSDWAAPYVAWAEFAALVPRGLDAASPLNVALFQQVLRRAGLRPDADATAAAGGLEWNVIARALGSLATRPQRRLPPCGIAARPYTQACEQHLGVRRPARELHRLAARDGAPTVGELCLALADFAARAPQAHAAPRKRTLRR